MTNQTDKAMSEPWESVEKSVAYFERKGRMHSQDLRALIASWRERGEVISMLVEELNDPCRTNLQEPLSAVWLSGPLRHKASAALKDKP